MGSSLRHAAPAFGRLRLSYTPNNLQLEARTFRNGAIFFSQPALSERVKPALYAADIQRRPYSPIWHTYTVKAACTYGSDPTLTAGIENITARRYRAYSCGLVAPGPNYVANMSYSFFNNRKKPGGNK